MGYVDLYATKYAYVDALGEYDSHTNSLQPVHANGKLLLRFPALDDSLKFRRLSPHWNLYISGQGYSYIGRMTILPDDFDEQTLTYQTVPQSAVSKTYEINKQVGRYYDSFIDSISLNPDGIDKRAGVENRTLILDNFRLASYPNYASELSFGTPLAESEGRRPYIRVNYSDADAGVTNIMVNSATNMNPHKALTFTWSYSVPQDTLEPLEVTAETFYWKTSEESTYHTVSVPPGSKSVVLAAETLPGASTIQYFVRVACNSGVSTDSIVFTTSTVAPTVGIRLISPDRTVENYSEAIKFKWEVTGQSGYGFAKTEIRYRRNGGAWTTLAEVQAPATEYNAPANTFLTGSIEWSARAYNADNVASDWASSSFVAFGAPAAPAVSVDSVPFVTVSWQASGQQASQIEIDGETVGVLFGDDVTQYTVKVPLADGNHTLRVRVQNQYGLWSEWTTIVFYIENEPDQQLTLYGLFGVDAELNWTTESATHDFLIFRDGALIGHAAALAFTDRHVLGVHEYYVINRLPGGNYDRSNTVSGLLSTERPMIALFSGGAWLSLRYSDRSQAEQRFRWSLTHSLRHISGARFPVLELSPYEDLSGTYDAAFLNAAEAEAFRELLGKIVILKSREGKVLVGALTDYSELVNTFYLSFQFTVEQIHWEDYVDDENT